jgi:hypothetical protein
MYPPIYSPEILRLTPKDHPVYPRHLLRNADVGSAQLLLAFSSNCGQEDIAMCYTYHAIVNEHRLMVDTRVGGSRETDYRWESTM